MVSPKNCQDLAMGETFYMNKNKKVVMNINFFVNEVKVVCSDKPFNVQ